MPDTRIPHVDRSTWTGRPDLADNMLAPTDLVMLETSVSAQPLCYDD